MHLFHSKFSLVMISEASVTQAMLYNLASFLVFHAHDLKILLFTYYLFFSLFLFYNIRSLSSLELRYKMFIPINEIVGIATIYGQYIDDNECALEQFIKELARTLMCLCKAANILNLFNLCQRL